MDDMIPCPFCGSEAFLVPSKSDLGTFGERGEHHRQIYPRCRLSLCIGNQGWTGFFSEKEAIEAWNARADTKPYAVEITCKECKKKGSMIVEE